MRRTKGAESWRSSERALIDDAAPPPYGPPACNHARWTLLRWNPLCWRVPRTRHTYGELVLVLLLGAQLAISLAAWLLQLQSRDSRHHARATGAPAALALPEHRDTLGTGVLGEAMVKCWYTAARRA